MSARRSPVERDARKIAAAALQRARRDKGAEGAYQVFEYAIHHRECATTWAVQRGDIPGARREARAAGLLDASVSRLLARRGRDNARKLAESGIVPGVRVRVVRVGYGPNAAPTGTVVTLGDDTTSPYIHGKDDDGRRWLVYAPDVELVDSAGDAHDVTSGMGLDTAESLNAEALAEVEYLEDLDAPVPYVPAFQVGEDVLTPTRGAGVVEHVDAVSGVTVRVEGDETWRYMPEQLTPMYAPVEDFAAESPAHVQLPVRSPSHTAPSQAVSAPMISSGGVRMHSKPAPPDDSTSSTATVMTR